MKYHTVHSEMNSRLHYQLSIMVQGNGVNLGEIEKLAVLHAAGKTEH